MTLEQHKSLRPFNTFGLDAQARYFATIEQAGQIKEAIQTGIRPLRVLGGGSNILFSSNEVEGLLIKNEIKGIRVVREWANRVHIEVGGGENWHGFVQWAVQQGYGGVENLSLIPGTTGAAPVQNIGAYGVEIKDIMVSLRATHLETGKSHHFTNAACAFGYRDSVFKSTFRHQFMITHVVFSLTKNNHRINTSYGDISKTLEQMEVKGTPTVGDISKAVIQIRSSKLPDPAKIGNCGSFFKNPEVPAGVLEHIRLTHPQAPGYPLPDNRVKIPAGWLIEQCGWKGKRVGNTGSYAQQALVLVNYGNATGTEVRQLAKDIIASVKAQFDVDLEAEVNIW